MKKKSFRMTFFLFKLSLCKHSLETPEIKRVLKLKKMLKLKSVRIKESVRIEESVRVKESVRTEECQN